MKKLFPIILTLAIIICGCGLKDVVGPISGTSSSDSYQPVSTGSTWTYNNQVLGIADYTSTIKMTGATTTINGNKYYAYNMTSAQLGAATGYYAQGGNMYRSRGTSLQAGVTVDMLYLDNNKAVGTTWTDKINDSGTVNGVPGRFVGKILEKNISKTIGGHTFNNVIHVTLDLQYDYAQGGGFETVMTYDYYVAKGVGLIEMDASLLGNVFSRENIVTYDIKY